MTKKFLAVSFLSLMLVACGGGNSSGNSGSGALELSQRDKELANGNPNVAAEILVQKAILQESKNEKLTEEEQYNLDLAKQEVEVNFYLQKKFDKDFSNVSAVSEEEAKKYYDEHKSEIGNTPFETIKDGDFYFNNQLFNYYLLKDYGVKEDKIFLNNRCTFKENFHSFRRDKELSGRNGAIMFMEV